MGSYYLIIAGASLVGLCVVAATLLHGWQGWLSLKAREIDLVRTGTDHPAAQTGMTARIEIADLKERIRKLEAIAAGVDL
jgi:hypothetical protein